MNAVAAPDVEREAARRRLHAKRKLANAVALTLALGAMAFGLFWLIWILIETVRLGLSGMAERARLAGGELDVRSAPGGGTTVSLRIAQLQRVVS